MTNTNPCADDPEGADIRAIKRARNIAAESRLAARHSLQTIARLLSTCPPRVLGNYRIISIAATLPPPINNDEVMN